MPLNSDERRQVRTIVEKSGDEIKDSLIIEIKNIIESEVNNKIVISKTPPSSPKLGTLWIDIS